MKIYSGRCMQRSDGGDELAKLAKLLYKYLARYDLIWCILFSCAPCPDL